MKILAVLVLQVVTFLKTSVVYQKQPAFCMILNRIPGLPLSVREEAKRYIKKNLDKGCNNNPRHFSSEELAAKRIVSFNFTKLRS